MAKVLLFTALILSIVVPFRLYFKGERTKKRYKVSLAVNAIAFFGLMLGTGLVMFGGQASAADAANTAAAATAAAGGMATGLGYLAAGLSIGLSCVGGGIAVASAASTALGAISEDSSILGKSLIFVGLAEGVCLYGLIIAFMILGKL